MSIAAIIAGWSRWMGAMSISDVQQNLSKSRLIVCSSCDRAKPSKVLEFINGNAEEVDGMYCNECLCPCLQKSLTNDLCPLGKWDKLETNIKP